MLGRLVTTHPRWILATGVALFAVLATIGVGALDALSLNRYDNPDAESATARAQLADDFGTGSPNIAIMVSPDKGTVDEADVAAIGARLTDRLAAYPGVGRAWSYWSANAPDTLASEDRRHALILAWAPGDADLVRGKILPGVESDLVDQFAGDAVDVRLGGGDEVFRDVAEQARTDFVRAEVIILPLVLLLLWLVYRRLTLAFVTLGIGLFCVVGTLALLRAVTAFTDVSTFASNIALVMGIGLGVDYGLFMTYRFREELTASDDVTRAVRRCVASAGRTIAFSAATVAASLAVLFVFPFPFLSSFAYAGIAVALMAVVGSLGLLPAALMLLGHRAARRTPRPEHEATFWHRVAVRVMRRPVVSGGAALIALLALGAPALGINFGSPDDRVLPSTQPVRAMYDTIRSEFATEDADALKVVTQHAEQGEVAPYATALSELPGVERVDSAAGAYVDGERTAEAGPGGPSRYIDGDATWLNVVPTAQRLAEDPSGLVADVRALDAPFEVSVGGYPADLADYRDGVVDRLPVVIALIAIVTIVLLFVMTGSVIAPLKAAVLNLLSMSVMFGALVWGFQQGALSDLLGFTPTGAIEPSIPILMFCIAYGLSMDYEVFLLARIKQDFDRTGDPVGSVPRGIARSAPLVTAAALVLAVSFAVYATGDVVFLQQIGIGMAVTVAVDATLIRGILVPALMRLAGRANWWAPGPLRRLHRRIGLREDPPPVSESSTDDSRDRLAPIAPRS